MWLNRPDVAKCYHTVDRRCGQISSEYVVCWTGQLSQHLLIPDYRSPLFRVQLTDESYSTPSYFQRDTSRKILFVLVSVFVKLLNFTSTTQWWSNHTTCSRWSVAFSLISPSCNAQYVATVNYPLPHMDCKLQLVQLVIICNWGICGMMVNVIE